MDDPMVSYRVGPVDGRLAEPAEVDDLRAEVAQLRRDVDRLYELLGEERES